jgi:hypothetical protein
MLIYRVYDVVFGCLCQSPSSEENDQFTGHIYEISEELSINTINLDSDMGCDHDHLWPCLPSGWDRAGPRGEIENSVCFARKPRETHAEKLFSCSHREADGI